MKALSTKEAKLFKALDKLEALISHNESSLDTWLPLEYDLQLNYGQDNMKFSSYMKAVRSLVDDWTRKKIAEEGTLGFVQNTATINASPVLIVETTVGKRSGYERDGSFTTAKGTHWESFDAGIAAQTFCLAAYEHGLGTIIMGYFDEDMIKELLGIDDEDMRVSAVIGLGYPAEEPVAPPRKDVEKLLTFV